MADIRNMSISNSSATAPSLPQIYLEIIDYFKELITWQQTNYDIASGPFSKSYRDTYNKHVDSSLEHEHQQSWGDYKTLKELIVKYEQREDWVRRELASCAIEIAWYMKLELLRLNVNGRDEELNHAIGAMQEFVNEYRGSKWNVESRFDRWFGAPKGLIRP